MRKTVIFTLAFWCPSCWKMSVFVQDVLQSIFEMWPKNIKFQKKTARLPENRENVYYGIFLEPQLPENVSFLFTGYFYSSYFE